MGRRLLRLLGRAIASAAVTEDGTVRITFDDGSLVDLLDTSSHDESYQLKLGDDVIIV